MTGCLKISVSRGTLRTLKSRHANLTPWATRMSAEVMNFIWLIRSSGSRNSLFLKKLSLLVFEAADTVDCRFIGSLRLSRILVSVAACGLPKPLASYPTILMAPWTASVNVSSCLCSASAGVGVAACMICQSVARGGVWRMLSEARELSGD